MNFFSPEASAFVLPLQLADGLVLSGIELECQSCMRTYRLTEGQGRASGKGRRVALAAQACCPTCTAPVHFLVVVDARLASARVQRVSRLGLWFAQLLIGLRASGRMPALAAPARHAVDPALADGPAHWAPLPVVLFRDDFAVDCGPESLGQFQGEAIPSWIDVAGVRCHFAGIAQTQGAPGSALSGAGLAPGEHLLAPGLLYREQIDEQV